MVRRTAILVTGLAAAILGAAKGLLKDRFTPDDDEIDLAAVAVRRRIRMRARPFIGATMLVVAASVELDLRRVVPAPTGIEVSVLMFFGSLRVVVPPDWRVRIDVKRMAALVDGPGGEPGDDSPTIWLDGTAWMSRIEVVQRSAPVAVAS